MQKKYFILIAYILLGFYNSYAQPYLLKHLGVEDGLSNNYVTNITQDKQGYIWIATESGLSRFDGRNFTTYKDNNSEISSNALNTLLYDEEENALWIGLKNGLSKLDCSTYRFTNHIADSIATNVVALAHSTDNKGILPIIMEELYISTNKPDNSPPFHIRISKICMTQAGVLLTTGKAIYI